MKFAILGIHPELSKAELEAVIKTNAVEFGSECLTFESDLNLDELQKRLGGTSKLGEVIAEIDDVQKLESTLAEYLTQQPADKKLKFGMSVYDLGGTSFSKNLRRENQKLGLSLKKSLKNAGRSVRLVTSTEPTLSSVVVAKNKLTTDGVEFCILITENKILIGVTKTYQDFADWSHRDYDRPRRNAKNGMLPPKLARMMINLSGLPTPNIQHPTLLDPFCGSGTILMEAVMLGFTKIYGTDLSKKIVEDAKENLEWLNNQKLTDVVPEISLADVRALDKKFSSSSIDVIVTEPFLGMPRQGDETPEQISKTVDELTMLLRDTFAVFEKILAPNGVCVIVAPVHIYKKTPIPVQIERLAVAFNLIPQIGPLRYAREGQFVVRDIWVFKRQP